jgi:heat shock protein HslJ
MTSVSRSEFRLLCCLAGAMLTAACGHPPAPPPIAAGTSDSLVLGEFEDDYGNRFTITPTLWHQLPGARYDIKSWHADQQYLIAQNDAANPGDPGLWSRIDWLELSGMPPYTWGFCLSAYRAPSAAAAESTHAARRDTPRTGCNGHPFSRMKRVVPGDSSAFDTEWLLMELKGQPAPKGAGGNPGTLKLQRAEGRVSGFAGCNRFAGPLTSSGNQLAFGPLLMTKMACRDGMELESAYAAALSGVSGYRVSSAGLELLAGAAVVARFVKQ